MNLSKMVAQDVPLFLSLLQDLFPQFKPPDKASYPTLFEALPRYIAKHNLVNHPDWFLKTVQVSVKGRGAGGLATAMRTVDRLTTMAMVLVDLGGT